MSTEKQASYLADLSQIYRSEAMKHGFDFDTFEIRQQSSRVDHQATTEKILKDMRSSQASKFISALIEYATVWGWRPTSKQSVVAEFSYRWAREHNRTSISRRDYDLILAWVQRSYRLQGDFRPLVFTENPGGGQNREPVSLEEAREKFRKQISGVRSKVNARLGSQDQDQDDEIGEENDEQLQHQQDEEQHGDEQDSTEEQLEEQLRGEIEEQRGEDQIPQFAESFWTRYVQIREFSEAHDVGGHQIDTIERRPYIAAAGMLAQEIPSEAIFWAMCMHWPEAIRRELNITEYDVRSYKTERRIDGLPPEFPYLDALYKARINPWLISPAGVGKTTVVRKFADHFGQPHCAIPLNRGTSPSAFNGRPKITNTSTMVAFLKAMSAQDEAAMTRIAKAAEDAGDVTISEFEKVFTSGGHILLDEIDAGDENLLMMVNMPLANARFANTATGKTLEMHPDTLIWAASNTMGLGVTAGQGREYRGRNALDFATIDRFRMGRVKMKGDINDYRKNFEELILAYTG